jgi:hypothetical protein
VSEVTYTQESSSLSELIYRTLVTVEKMQGVDTQTLTALSTVITRLNEVIAFQKGLEWRIRELENKDYARGRGIKPGGKE